MNSDTALDGNLDTFYKRIQGPYGHFKDSILVMLSYLQTSLKWVNIIHMDILTLIEFITAKLPCLMKTRIT